MKGLTCPNCGAPVNMTGLEELDAYLKRGWSIICLPREIADQIEGRMITRHSAAEINDLMRARERDAELRGEEPEERAPVVRTVEHLTMAGPVAQKDGVGKGGPEYQATCSCSWAGPRRAKRAKAQKDGIDHRREALKVWASPDDYRRADGAAICDSCRTTYRSHPVEEFGDLALHRLCDGSLVKL